MKETMRKVYQAPAIEVLECMMTEMIADSGVASDNGIGYGGIDEDGTMDAESRILFNVHLFDE